MKLTFKYGDRNLKLEPYTTKQEKDILLLSSFQETPDFTELGNILGDNININLSELPIIEQKMLYYKLRTNCKIHGSVI